MRDILMFLTLCVAGFFGIFALFAVPAVLADAYSCSRTAETMGIDYRYSIWTDCMIKTDGRWEPLKWQRSARIKE